MQPVIFEDLQIIDYKTAWDHQEKLLQENLSIKAAACHAGGEGVSTRHHFLLCEHPPVYTLGKRGKMEHVLLSAEQLSAKGISFFKTNRGGDITFHGPQQIVGYPILDLEKIYTDIGRYLNDLEEVVILTIAQFGIRGMRSVGETGVWIDADIPGRERKICAIGVRCSRWVTMHGFALNVNTDLAYFDFIVPCGIPNKQVTSIQKELGRRVDMEEIKAVLKSNFEQVFNVSLSGKGEALPAGLTQ
jgi:lipoyl(octanoyl) transferase